MAIQRISKAQFKAKALEILRRVEKTGTGVIITGHGRATVEVRPYHEQKKDPLARLKGSILAYHDPTNPVGDKNWETR